MSDNIIPVRNILSPLENIAPIIILGLFCRLLWASRSKFKKILLKKQYKPIGLEVFSDVIITFFDTDSILPPKDFQLCAVRSAVLLRMIRWKKPAFNTALYDKYSWNMIYGTGKNAPHLWHIYWKLLESQKRGEKNWTKDTFSMTIIIIIYSE